MLGATWDEGVHPVLTLTSRVGTRRPRRRSHHAFGASPARHGVAGGVPAADAPHPHRRHRQDDGRCDYRAPRHRPRQGARDLRVDRRQHVSRSEDGRLRRRRHPLHAGVEEPGRQVRRPQRAVCRPGARGRPAGARRLRPAGREVRQGIPQPGALVRQRHEGAALPGGGVSGRVTAGCRSIRPTCRKVVLEEPPGQLAARRRAREDRPRAAVRFVGDELDRVQLRARRQAARLEARHGRLLHVPAGRNRQRPPRQPRSGQLQIQHHGQRDCDRS